MQYKFSSDTAAGAEHGLPVSILNKFSKRPAESEPDGDLATGLSATLASHKEERSKQQYVKEKAQQDLAKA